MKPNNPPPKRSSGEPLPPLEVVEASSRRRWPPGTPTVDLIPCGDTEVVELFGQVQTLVDHLCRAKRLFAAGKWATQGPAFLAEVLPLLQQPRRWQAFDRTVAALPPELAADFLTAAGPGLAVRWAKSDLDRHRAAAAAWLSAHREAVWDGLTDDDRRVFAELVTPPAPPR